MGQGRDVRIEDLLAEGEWLRRLAYHLAGEAADDVLQDTWLAAQTSLPDPSRPPRPWLARILKNLLYTRRRNDARRAGREREYQALAPERGAAVDEVYERAELHRFIADKVMKLEEPLRVVVLLRYFEGLDSGRIAEMVDAPAGTVRWRLKQALDQLRLALDEKQGGDRRRWAVLLAPAATAPVIHGASIGVFLMTNAKAKTFLGLALMVLLVLGGLGFWWRTHDTASTRTSSADSRRLRGAGGMAMGDPSQAPGAVEGTVKDAEGRAVDNATVIVAPVAQPGSVLSMTAGGGRFRVDGLGAGRYSVTAVSIEGTPGRQSPVEIASNRTTGVALTLGRGGALFAGDVVDVGGGAVEGATVGMNGLVSGVPQRIELKTKSDGKFAVRMTEGNYDVSARAQGYAPAYDFVVLSHAQSRHYRLNPAARIFGRVVERTNGKGVPGAQIWLKGDRLQARVERQAEADDDGRFSFEDLAAGGYVVGARSGKMVGFTRALRVAFAQALTDVEVAVDTGRAIGGRVVMGDGKGVAQVLVTAGPTQPPYDPSVSATSGGDGRFTLVGLLPGEYRLVPSRAGYSSANDPLAQVGSRDVDGIRVEIMAATSVSGTVVDEHDNVVAGASVVARVQTSAARGSRAIEERTTTDGTGHFGIEISAGKLRLVARSADGVIDWGPEDLGGEPKTVTLRLGKAGSVSGSVRFDDGKAVPGVLVGVVALPGAVLRPSVSNASTSTDADGKFRLGGLPKGNFTIAARRGFWNFNQDPQSRQEVALQWGEDRTGLELLMRAGGKRISGRVVDADGKPVAGATVLASREGYGPPSRRETLDGLTSGDPWTTTDHEGAFAIEDMEDGYFALWATHPSFTDAELNHVASGTNNLVLRLEKAGVLAGRVQTGDGKPVTAYKIVALPRRNSGAGSIDLRRANDYRDATLSPSAQVNDPSGAFEIAHVAAGEHLLRVAVPDGQSASFPVSLRAGENKTGLVVITDPGVRVTGRVVELENGAGLEGLSASAVLPGVRLRAATASDGTFTIEEVPVGHVRIEVMSETPNVYVSEYKELDIGKGPPSVDAGLFRLIKGSIAEKVGGMGNRGYLGFSVERADGLVQVRRVLPNLPGATAGLREGDVLLSINGKSLEGLGSGALDYTLAGRLGEKVTVQLQPKDGGPTRTVTMDRVPLGYGTNRTPSGSK
jgi:RNA polymerase sigma-70 factor (ECF subfamily)